MPRTAFYNAVKPGVITRYTDFLEIMLLLLTTLKHGPWTSKERKRVREKIAKDRASGRLR